jgi:hypothetical protein
MGKSGEYFKIGLLFGLENNFGSHGTLFMVIPVKKLPVIPGPHYS